MQQVEESEGELDVDGMEYRWRSGVNHKET